MSRRCSQHGRQPRLGSFLGPLETWPVQTGSSRDLLLRRPLNLAPVLGAVSRILFPPHSSLPRLLQQDSQPFHEKGTKGRHLFEISHILKCSYSMHTDRWLIFLQGGNSELENHALPQFWGLAVFSSGRQDGCWESRLSWCLIVEHAAHCPPSAGFRLASWPGLCSVSLLDSWCAASAWKTEYFSVKKYPLILIVTGKYVRPVSQICLSESPVNWKMSPLDWGLNFSYFLSYHPPYYLTASNISWEISLFASSVFHSCAKQQFYFTS